MGTQDFIDMLHNVCDELLPIVLFVLIIYVIKFIRGILKTLNTLNKTLNTTTQVLENCDKQITKLDAPLATVNELSQTVDQVHEVTKNALTSSLVILINNLSTIKDYLLKKMGNDTEDTTEVVIDDEELEV